MKELVQEKWDEILNYLKVEYNITKVSYTTWLLPLKVFDVTDNTVIISLDDKKIGAHSLGYMKKKYGLFIKTAIAEVMNEDFDVEFILLSEAIKEAEKNNYNHNPRQKNNSENSFLNSKYTFDTFVVGPNNNLAHAASLAVSESPGEVYNPLFIYGGVGLGKTHLMHSIAHHVINANRNAKVLYVTSEKFTNELIDAIRGLGTTPAEFREKYRNNDVLLIDDIQFIIGKESTQEEFFHTFNTLHESKKQIIISSDKPPKDILTLEERLRSRFEWGLTVDISSPDYETRMAILHKKEEMDGLTISNEILNYIATNIKSNIRELEGALTKIHAMSRLQKREINIALAEEALKDTISPDDKKTITLDMIVNIIAEYYNITYNDIYSNNRSRNIAFPRQICMYLGRKFTGLSLGDIGKLMGNRDHSTILHGFNKIERDIKSDSSVKNVIDLFIKKINPEQ